MAEEWRPGSFTKNYSWGPLTDGLKRLHEAIQVGFDGKLEAVSREDFRSRIAKLKRPDFIPLNFFLFNEVRGVNSYLIVDELVFQALTFQHGPQFDKLALFAFNFSNVGQWKNAKKFQAEPALWARHYVSDRLAGEFAWSADRISADDIERFVKSDSRYTGNTARKLATNLNYLFRAGKIQDFSLRKPERWWLSAVFLTLDRLVGDKSIEFSAISEARLLGRLAKSDFWELAGRRSKAKDIAAAYFVTLYTACDGRHRFSDEAVLKRERKLLPNHVSNEEPSAGAVGVFHPTDPTSRNAIPHACRVLARYLAGFEIFEFDEFESFDVEGFIRERTEAALNELSNRSIRPKISADDLTKLLRGE